MNRRTFHRVLSAAFASNALRAMPEGQYEPTWESIRTHTVPDWYNDAKLGIFIHWGLYSVPAWAPPSGELGKVDPNKWFYQNPYAEWYLNSLRLNDSPTYKHHIETYGANFDYYDFVSMFDKDVRNWKPVVWARLFRETGARYVVLTSKHHDGFRLWPSRVPNPKRPGGSISARRDLVGELTAAVRAEGLKMGLYYSGGLDWTFETRPIATREDLKTTAPQTEEYARYADAHWRELIERYQPSVMWNDITYPKIGKLTEIFAEYYNRVPEGVIDNRFGVDFSDFTTPEYSHYDQITPKKWESCRGLGFSFGYNRVEGTKEVIAPDKLVALLIDIVSKNGNLLLNIGPRPDGSISEIQLDRLHALGLWLDVNGDGIFGTRPWVRASAKSAEGTDIRFTSKADSLYAFLLGRPEEHAIAIPSLAAASHAEVSLLGTREPVKWSQNGDSLVIRTGPLSGDYAWGLKITPAPQSM
ncbi:MAG TPA: alpha-L-fucosidase [Candidatus Solibacter sp.]|nr:alpha-L-fucosidase [Candidatus Solibacter sp.]